MANLTPKCTESHKTVPCKVKASLNKQRDLLYLWFGRLNINKLSVHPKLMYPFSVIPIKTSAGYL